MKRPATYRLAFLPRCYPPRQGIRIRWGAKLRNLIRGKLLHRQPAWVEHAVMGPGGVEVDPEWAGMEGVHGPGLEDEGEELVM